MSQTVQSDLLARIESIARVLPPSAREDARQFFLSLVHNITALSPGGNLLQIGGAKASASKAPSGVTHTVTGANAQFTIAITNPETPQGTQIYHELSYSPLKSFTQNVTTMPATTGNSIQIPSPGGTFFFRLRSSFDKKTWSNYQYSSASAISAGLVKSSAISSGGTFNQTNFALVNSSAAGGAAAITVNGTGGANTPYVAVKGGNKSQRPSASIVNVPPNAQQFVGWDGKQFQVKGTLAEVLGDDLEPIGAVSVVSTGPPVLPTISPVIVGGFVVGYSVTNGGSGASGPYVLTFGAVGGGVGATFGAQTIQNGVLIAIAPGNPGSGYAGGTTVTASGGTGAGTGGGTATGGNGGRMTAV